MARLLQHGPNLPNFAGDLRSLIYSSRAIAAQHLRVKHSATSRAVQPLSKLPTFIIPSKMRISSFLRRDVHAQI